MFLQLINLALLASLLENFMGMLLYRFLSHLNLQTSEYGLACGNTCDIAGSKGEK